jgi:hypothetical protein
MSEVLAQEGSFSPKEPTLDDLRTLEETFMAKLALHLEELPDDAARQAFLEGLYRDIKAESAGLTGQE